MMDISAIRNGEDLVIRNVSAPKAANVIRTQLGSLEYAPNFGSDLNFFLDEQFEFQNESFQAYLVERLAIHQVVVTDAIMRALGDFSQSLDFSVGDYNEEGMIR